jgi:hypothetical protein
LPIYLGRIPATPHTQVKDEMARFMTEAAPAFA